MREIASWTSLEVRLLLEYLSKQPAPEERIDIGVAHLTAIMFNANRGNGVPAAHVKDFLPYLNPWAMQRYSDLDRELMAALGR